MAKDPLLWIASTVRVLMKRIDQLEDTLQNQHISEPATQFKWNVEAPEFVPVMNTLLNELVAPKPLDGKKSLKHVGFSQQPDSVVYFPVCEKTEYDSDDSDDYYAEIGEMLWEEHEELRLMKVLATNLANIRLKTYSYDASVEHVKRLREEESRQKLEQLKETDGKNKKKKKKQKHKLKEKDKEKEEDKERRECEEREAFDDFEDYVNSGGTDDFAAFLIIREG